MRNINSEDIMPPFFFKKKILTHECTPKLHINNEKRYVYNIFIIKVWLDYDRVIVELKEKNILRLNQSA